MSDAKPVGGTCKCRRCWSEEVEIEVFDDAHREAARCERCQDELKLMDAIRKLTRYNNGCSNKLAFMATVADGRYVRRDDLVQVIEAFTGEKL